MVAKIPQSIKTKVLNEWLQGFTRNKIAENNGIGAGTVTDTINRPETKTFPTLT
jgi:hypothetical protein